MKVGLFICFFSLHCFGFLHLEVRYHHTPTEANFSDQTFIQHLLMSENIDIQLGAQLASSFLSVRSLTYKGEITWSPFEYFSLNLRHSHHSYLREVFRVTELSSWIEVSLPLPFIKLSSKFGWYERFLSLGSSSILPTFARPSPDRDFLAEIAIELKPLPDTSTELSLSTFDEMDSFNFNNPYLKLLTQVEFRDFSVFAFVRYQVLLGFGRLDDLTLGLGTQVTL